MATPLPVEHPLSFWKGSTFEKRIRLYVGGSTTTARDLTGYTGVLLIVPPGGDAPISANATITPLTGTIDMALSSTQTAVDWNQARYTITISNGARVETLLWGKIAAKGI